MGNGLDRVISRLEVTGILIFLIDFYLCGNNRNGACSTNLDG